MPVEESALEVLDKQDPPSTTPPSSEKSDDPSALKGKEGLLKLMADHGDVTEQGAKEIKESKDDKEASVKAWADRRNKETKAETADPAKKPQVTDSPDKEKSEATKVDDAEMKQLAAALQRYNATKADHELLTKGDPDKVEFARHLLKIQTDNDKSQETRIATETELTELRAKVDAQTKAEESKKETKAKSAFDLNSAVKPLTDYLSESLGEDASESVANSFKTILDKVESDHAIHLAAVTKQFEAVEGRMFQLQDSVIDAQFQNACNTLLKDYPQLEDANLRTAVRTRMFQIAGSQKFDSVLDAARSAAQIEVAPLLHKENEDYKKKHRTAKAQGVTDLNTDRQAEATAPTRKSMLRDALRYRNPDSTDYDVSKAEDIESKMRAMRK